MKRIFDFTWYKNEKYGQPMQRTNRVMVVSNGDIGQAAKAATNVFTKNFGNLKRNTIISIQEINEKGEKVGEPIIPQDETSIIPASVGR